jgi:plasmid stability protein
LPGSGCLLSCLQISAPGGRPLATLVIRNVDDALHLRLKACAAAQGRSMEEEARQVLREGLAAEPLPEGATLASAMRALFEPLGGLSSPAYASPATNCCPISPRPIETSRATKSLDSA